MSINGEIKVRIKIMKNGPYLVTGKVPLRKTAIVPKGRINEYHPVQEFQHEEEFALCRCGHSSSHPFCDRTHEKLDFVGKETASRASYEKRAEYFTGPGLDLMDDNRCAYARFCHRKEGIVWELVKRSDDPKMRAEAIIGAIECPTGRLVAIDKEGNPIEPVLEPAIELLEDKALGVSGPIFVKGNIPIESADGSLYEVRNRVALCRCGQSSHKPFCDATHVSIGFNDERKQVL